MLDGVFTFIGLKFQLILEVNPLMHFMWTTSPFYFLISKLFLSLLLIYLAFYFRTQYKHIWNLILVIPLCLYTGVFLIHIIWIGQLI